MEPLTVTASANAGISVTFHGVRIWLDALHKVKVPNFSTVTPELLEQVLEHPGFTDPDAIIYSHCHPDHYSRSYTLRALERRQEAKLILPRRQYPQQLVLEGDEVRTTVKGLSLTFKRLPHEGELYADVPHYGTLLSDGEREILFPSDCALCAPALQAFVKGHRIDTVFLDFPWVTLTRGIPFVREVLHPRTLVIYHLPFEADDPCGYRAAARRAVRQLADIPQVFLLSEPLQTLTL